MGSIKYGAEQAVKNCVKLQPQEKMVMITDTKSLHIADEIVGFAEQISPGNLSKYIMEDYGDRPEDGSNPLNFPDEIGHSMLEANVSFYCAGGKKGELQSFRVPMIGFVDKNQKLRHAHMPGINDELMTTGMSVDYDKVQHVHLGIFHLVINSQPISLGQHWFQLQIPLSDLHFHLESYIPAIL